MQRRLLLSGVVLLVGILAIALWRLPTGANLPEKAQSGLVEVSGSGMPRAELLPDAALPGNSVPLAATVVGLATPLAAPGNGFRHLWPAVQAVARFGGDEVLAAFEDPVNRYRLTVDGDAGPVLTLTRPGTSLLRLAGLGPGTHEMRLEKLNESWEPATFGGFFVPPGGDALPPPPLKPRRIDFIGDSDTVGYGNTSPRRKCIGDQVYLATDTGQSFGPRVARHFDADYRIIARSGIGLVRNIDGVDPGNSMTTVYRAIRAEHPRTPESPAADIVVVALGSNDFGELREGEAWADEEALRADFQAALLDFLRRLREDNPSVLLILLAFGEYGDALMSAHRAAFEGLRADGARVQLVILPELERDACDWHPSLDDHAMIADRLIEAIGDKPGEWSASSTP